MKALFHRATTHPNGTAFIFNEVVWTYSDLLAGAEQLSRAFLARGVRPGDRVVLHLPNTPEMAVAVYACFRIGAIACPTNLRFKTAELRELFQRLRPALYLGEEQLYSHVETIEPEILAEEKRFVTGPSGAYKGARPWSALLTDSISAGLMPPEPEGSASDPAGHVGNDRAAQVRRPHAGDDIGDRGGIRGSSRRCSDRAQSVPDGTFRGSLHLSSVSELRRRHDHGRALRS
jgi:acyl-CoA synthetase (AMP-forming)/AMP-acid ligase II